MLSPVSPPGPSPVDIEVITDEFLDPMIPLAFETVGAPDVGPTCSVYLAAAETLADGYGLYVLHPSQ